MQHGTSHQELEYFVNSNLGVFSKAVMKLSAQKNHLFDLLGVIVLYVMLMAFHGYRFGDEDMMESLSYANYLLDSSLYPADLYIQALAESKWNERYIFALVLSWGGKDPAWYCYLIHLTTSIAFVWACLLIAQKYIVGRLWQFLFLITFFFISYYINLGENEAWYNYLMPSYLAKTLAIWGIYFFLIKRENIAFIILMASTFFHPIVGAQLALLFGLTLLAQWWPNRQLPLPGWQGMLTYAATSGLWIMIIFYRHLVADQAISNPLFYEIMETRLGHHFFPSYYPVKHWIILIPLFIGAAVIWKKKEKRLWLCYLFCGVGMVIYFFVIEVFEWPQFLSLQWFKTTVWLKLLSLIALFSLFDRLKVSQQWNHYLLAIGLVLGLTLSIIQFNKEVVAKNRPYHFPFTSYSSDEVELADQIRSALPNTVVLLAPPNLTALRYYSQRSLYIDYKSNIHTRSYLAEAHRRREEVYGMNLAWKRAGKYMVGAGVDHYRNLTDDKIAEFKSNGVTHYLVNRKHANRQLKVVVENDSFVVYEL